jgi:hypothetical protein
MADERTIRTLRLQAWERAKGELNAMRRSYWWDDDKFEWLDNLLTEFVEEVEGKGLHE